MMPLGDGMVMEAGVWPGVTASTFGRLKEGGAGEKPCLLLSSFSLASSSESDSLVTPSYFISRSSRKFLSLVTCQDRMFYVHIIINLLLTTVLVGKHLAAI